MLVSIVTLLKKHWLKICSRGVGCNALLRLFESTRLVFFRRRLVKEFLMFSKCDVKLIYLRWCAKVFTAFSQGIANRHGASLQHSLFIGLAELCVASHCDFETSCNIFRRIWESISILKKYSYPLSCHSNGWLELDTLDDCANASLLHLFSMNRSFSCSSFFCKVYIWAQFWTGSFL